MVAWPLAAECRPWQLLCLHSVPPEVLTASLPLLIFIDLNFAHLHIFSTFFNFSSPTSTIFSRKKNTLCLSLIVQGLFGVLWSAWKALWSITSVRNKGWLQCKACLHRCSLLSWPWFHLRKCLILHWWLVLTVLSMNIVINCFVLLGF